MTTISLSIEQKSKHLGHRVIHQEIRLIARAVFVNNDRQILSIERTGIVDTGAPISVIPYFIWKNLH